MILLISPHASVRDCAGMLGQTLGEATDSTVSLDQATARLRSQEYSAVVFDQMLMESEPDDAKAALEHLGTAIPVYVNFGISNGERVLREVRCALMRRHRDEQAARHSAEKGLRCELTGIVTAMLLSCELALEDRAMSEPALEKIRSLHDLTLQLKSRLGVVS